MSLQTNSTPETVYTEHRFSPMSFETPLLAQTRQFAESLLSQLPESYTYHNLAHTSDVVTATEFIGSQSNLTDREMEDVLMAAWLHDIGYTKGCHHHEATSIELAEPFLRTQHLDEARICVITNCILATRMPQHPRTRVEEILCDADLFHLGSPHFLEKSELLRQEIKRIGNKISKENWLKGTGEMLERHHYFTAYGKNVLAPQKEKNLEKIRKRIAEHENGTAHSLNESSGGAETDPLIAGKSKKDKKEKELVPTRGIETMFRVTSHNHIQLSAIADTKANIMISVNSIIVSLILSILIRKLEELPQLVIPTVMLTVSCLMATVFAILAARPNVTTGRFTKEDIENKRANLLFFGNFHQMPLEEYEWGIKEMMADANFLYAGMTRDIYFLGRVLGKKYQLLRISYTIFMFGFIVSVIAFAIAAYLYPMQND